MQNRQHPTCAAQNQFTAYLLAAIHNYKRVFLKRNAQIMLTEVAYDHYAKDAALSADTDHYQGLPLMQQIENERLFSAMQELHSRDRHIFLARVLEERSLSEIAQSLGITYGAAAMSYHRTISRLRNALDGDGRE